MKSIKTRVSWLILPLITLLCLIFGITNCLLNYRTASGMLKLSIPETAIVAANHVAAEIKAIQAVAVQTGCTARLANNDVTVEDKKALILQTKENYNFINGNLLNMQGISLFDGNDYSERDYFKAALQGKTFISDPVISKITGKMSLIISAPLWEGGIPQTKVVGVVYFLPNENFLNDIVRDIKVSESGVAFLLNKNGTTVADKDQTLVGVDNHIEEAKTDPTIADIAAIHKKMILGEYGFGTYEHEGERWVNGYAPVANTDGWSIGVMAMEKDFLGEFRLALLATAITVVIFLIVGVLASIKLGNQIGMPISKCVARLELMADGDLSSPVPVVKTKDETGVLSRKLMLLQERLSMVVSDVTYTLTEMADGNISIPDLRAYDNDFLQLSKATNKIIASFNDAISQIDITSEEVSSRSTLMASGAQALSQGATEQACSVEELSAAIMEIREKVQENAKNAESANNISGGASLKLTSANEEMQRMLLAMSDISESSKKISNIIKTINDIAFQTNILALNAAVEAARAGSAGKGFAVVADEVRNLANKSSEAVKSTTKLINNSIQAVENGKTLADNTAMILRGVMVESEQSVMFVGKIAEASDEQARSISQITSGIEQISEVVQTNSATAEESAASSEELMGQAQMLNSLVERFVLRDVSKNTSKNNSRV